MYKKKSIEECIEVVPYDEPYRLMPGVSEAGVVAGVVGAGLAVVKVLGSPLGGLLLLPPALTTPMP